MKVSLLMKTVPAVVIAFMAISKHPFFSKSKNSRKSVESPLIIHHSGQVLQTLQDERYLYTKIISSAGKIWVATDKKTDPFPTGSFVDFEIASKTKAYESITLSYAFDEMMFSKNFERIEPIQIDSQQFKV